MLPNHRHSIHHMYYLLVEKRHRGTPNSAIRTHTHTAHTQHPICLYFIISTFLFFHSYYFHKTLRCSFGPRPWQRTQCARPKVAATCKEQQVANRSKKKNVCVCLVPTSHRCTLSMHSMGLGSFARRREKKKSVKEIVFQLLRSLGRCRRRHRHLGSVCASSTSSFSSPLRCSGFEVLV